MPQTDQSSGFALYEVLLGVTIFVVGILSLGWAVENCLRASTITSEEAEIRQILSNRMAEVQATPGPPDDSKVIKYKSVYGEVVVTQKAATADIKNREGEPLNGLRRVTLTARWPGESDAGRTVEFYVFRAG